jgi:CheY-like chemotaxis protein
MQQIKLIHWKAEEVPSREEILQDAGYIVDSQLDSGPKFLKQLVDNPPATIVIDLSRLPSQGRDLALMIRKRQGTRNIPIVFVGGKEAKVAQVRGLLPDATYTSWDDIQPALENAISNPLTDPIVHNSIFAGYAGKPLVEKLGIKTNTLVCLMNAPPNFLKTLGDLPPKVNLLFDQHTACDLTIWFCKSKSDLDHNISRIVNQSHHGPVWIAWPKQKSSLSSDLTQQYVRQVGLANRLVDYKLSAFDETWSGLLFRYRKLK